MLNQQCCFEMHHSHYAILIFKNLNEVCPYFLMSSISYEYLPLVDITVIFLWL